MLVGRTGMFGTIGGGALEHLVVDKARRLMRQRTGGSPSGSTCRSGPRSANAAAGVLR
jgi:xanthine/CO dehydrogenase XdhC/CoxF family maturation factor